MDDLSPPWPEHRPRREHTTPVEDLAVVRALTDRVVALEQLVRFFTYRDGDGAIRTAKHSDIRVDTMMSVEQYRLLDRLHPPLEADEEGR